MKIAYVITRADEIGGAHIHVRDLARWMGRRGHEARVFVGGSGPYTELLEDAGVSFQSLQYLRRPISPFTDWRAVGELAGCLSEYAPDLVSLHSAKAGLLGRLACRRAGLKVLFTAHGWAFTDGVPQPSRLVYRLLERWAAPMACKIVTVCHADRRFALEQNVGRDEQIVAINNGMPEIGAELIADPVKTPARLVMVARFEQQKDHVTLIEALNRIENGDWRLDLVGAGPLAAEIRNLVENRGLADRVRFLGRRDDVPQILAASDIFVLASFWEGFPRSILEAMRAALPVVASDVAGVAEAIDDGETGYLVEPGNVEQMRGRLQSLIDDSELRRTMGRSGRDKFERCFTFETMAGKTLAVYESVLAT